MNNFGLLLGVVAIMLEPGLAQAAAESLTQAAPLPHGQEAISTLPFDGSWIAAIGAVILVALRRFS